MNKLEMLAQTIPVEFLPLISGVLIPMNFENINLQNGAKIVSIENIDDFLSAHPEFTKGE